MHSIGSLILSEMDDSRSEASMQSKDVETFNFWKCSARKTGFLAVFEAISTTFRSANALLLLL
jgi:hypothetical protein